jgi:hypothetical protein
MDARDLWNSKLASLGQGADADRYNACADVMQPAMNQVVIRYFVSVGAKEL